MYRVFGAFSDIGDLLDEDESVEFRLPPNGAPARKRPYAVSKGEFKYIRSVVEKIRPSKMEYDGAIQGVVHAWYKETERPHIKVRDLQSGALIDCYYRRSIYRSIIEVLDDPAAVIFVHGRILADSRDKTIESIEIERLRAYSPLTKSDLLGLFGSIPNMTGDLSTADLLRHERGADD
jgi:hypothetical protein